MCWVVATPIGNLGDCSPRALSCLRAADVIACEDTRRTWALLSHFGIPRPRELLSYREHHEGSSGHRVLQRLGEGARVVLCSDGGYPGISDPGYRLVRDIAAAGHPLVVIPGPGAVEPALIASGLPTSSFTFKGFPPRKPGPLRRFFEEEQHAAHTLVLFESPFRVAPTLEAALAVLGDREAAVCLELTKKYERVVRGYLADLAPVFRAKAARGEVTLVIAGNHPRFTRAGAGGPDPEPPDDPDAL